MPKAVTEKETKAPKKIEPLKDKVKLNVAPPTKSDYGKTFYVSVNGYNAAIKYGEDVEVPRFVAAVIDNQKLADIEVARKLQK